MGFPTDGAVYDPYRPEILNHDDLAKDAQDQQKTAQERIVSLNDVRILAEKQKLLEEEVEALEAQVLNKKAELRKVAEEELPELLNMVGLPSITLADGSIIQVTENISASITDENRGAVMTWLRANNLEDLIKNSVTVTFGKGEDKEAERLVAKITIMAKTEDFHFGTLDQKEVVHPSTLKAFVKERLKEGLPLPADTFKLFIGQVCRIRKPKIKS